MVCQDAYVLHPANPEYVAARLRFGVMTPYDKTGRQARFSTNPVDFLRRIQSNGFLLVANLVGADRDVGSFNLELLMETDFETVTGLAIQRGSLYYGGGFPGLRGKPIEKAVAEVLDFCSNSQHYPQKIGTCIAMVPA